MAGVRISKVQIPMDVPLNSERETMIEALVAQVQRIMAVAYPPSTSAEITP